MQNTEKEKSFTNKDLLMFRNIQNTYKMMHFKYLNNFKKLVFQASRRNSLFFMQEEEISCLGTKKPPVISNGCENFSLTNFRIGPGEWAKFLFKENLKISYRFLYALNMQFFLDFFFKVTIKKILFFGIGRSNTKTNFFLEISGDLW